MDCKTSGAKYPVDCANIKYQYTNMKEYQECHVARDKRQLVA